MPTETIFYKKNGRLAIAEATVEDRVNQNTFVAERHVVASDLPEGAELVRGPAAVIRQKGREVIVHLNAEAQTKYFVRYEHTDDNPGKIREVDTSRPIAVTLLVDRRRNSSVSVHVGSVQEDAIASKEVKRSAPKTKTKKKSSKKK